MLLQRCAFQLAAVLVEIPVRQTVDRGDDGRVGAEQRRNQIDDGGNRMRLQRDDDDILRPELCGIIRAAHFDGMFLAVDAQLHAVRLHRREMRSARHETHVRTGSRELRAHIAADRTGALHADLHGSSPEDV